MGTGGLYCQTNEKWHRIAGAACIYVLTKWRYSPRLAKFNKKKSIATPKKI
jgi:hypothetical protein